MADIKEKRITVLREWHSRIIGKGGETVKEIKEKSGCAIEFPPKDSTSEEITLKGTTKQIEAAEKAIKKVTGELDKERKKSDKVYEGGHDKVDKVAAERDKLFKDAETAYAAGDKEKAAQLREKAKKMSEKMDKKKDEAAKKMLEHKNKGRDANEIDLHGLQAKAAVDATEKFLASKKIDRSKPGVIITGKGSHSGPEGPKLTAAVEQFLKDKGVKYTGPVDGTFTITLPAKK